MGNSNESTVLTWLPPVEDAYWSGMTENDKLYELELKPEVDIASYELRKMADARTQQVNARCAALFSSMWFMSHNDAVHAKWDIRDLASASISSIEDNLFGILIAVDLIMYPG